MGPSRSVAGMRSSRRIMAASVVVLMVAAFAFLAQPARAATNRPTWAAGDFWVYAYSASAVGTRYSGTLRLDVLGTDSVTLNGTPYSSYHVKGSVNYDFGGASVTYRGDLWYTVDSLAIAKISITLNFTGTIEVTIWGNPPQSIHWPLTAGDSWNSATDITIKEVLNGNTTSLYQRLSTTFTVQADQTITVPAGTFTTAPVKQTTTGSTAYTINYWSPQAGNSVRTEGYNGTGGGPSGSYNLTSYNYQAGTFFTTVFVGLPVWVWLLLLILVVAAVVGVMVVRRRRPPVAAPPGWMPPQQPPSGPEPPASPP